MWIDDCIENVQGLLWDYVRHHGMSEKEIPRINYLTRRVGEKIEQLIPGRVTAIEMPCFLVEVNGQQQTKCVMTFKMNVIGDTEDEWVECCAKRITENALATPAHTLFVKWLLIPGGMSEKDSTLCHPIRWRYRILTTEGNLFIPSGTLNPGDEKITNFLKRTQFASDDPAKRMGYDLNGVLSNVMIVQPPDIDLRDVSDEDVFKNRPV